MQKRTTAKETAALRFDMHCHTKYGSIDAKVAITEYVKILKDKGYDGMLVTDHDSYDGYNVWKKTSLSRETEFVVLKGIEYDTRDAGHFIVIMPDGIELKALTLRGMSVRSLVDLVHEYGGILGPAHPFGTRSSSAMLFHAMKKSRNLINEFDFIEAFNACEAVEANRLSNSMAYEYVKPMFGGSDSHDHKYVGMGYTDIDADIRSNNDLIKAVKDGTPVSCGGKERGWTFKSMNAHAFYSVYGFILYNKVIGALISPYRSYKLKQAGEIDDRRLKIRGSHGKNAHRAHR